MGIYPSKVWIYNDMLESVTHTQLCHTHNCFTHATLSHTHTTLSHKTLSHTILTPTHAHTQHFPAQLYHTHTKSVTHTQLFHTWTFTCNSFTQSVFQHLLCVSCSFHPTFTAVWNYWIFFFHMWGSQVLSVSTHIAWEETLWNIYRIWYLRKLKKSYFMVNL